MATPRYSITPCCPQFGTTQYFRLTLPPEFNPFVDGVYQYEGAQLNEGLILEPGACYTIAKSGFIGGSTYPLIDLGDFAQIGESGCSDPACLACSCYMLIPCDGSAIMYTQNSDYERYLNSFIYTYVGEDFAGCVYVIKLVDTDCENVVNATPNAEIECDCPLNCYYVGNTNGFFYVDANDTVIEVSAVNAKPFVRVCSKIQPVPQNSSVDYQIVNTGACVEGECADQCYKLVNCQDATDVIYTNSSSVIPYVYGSNNVVKISNREGCYLAQELDPEEVCNCPVDVLITTSYADCVACTGYTAYKLTNCDTGDIRYTLSDLSAYVDKVVETDCGCNLVELIDYLPANPEVIVVDYVFDSCSKCAATYYLLRDCSSQEIFGYTTADLSAWIGDFIKIPNCDVCLTVEETREPGSLTNITSYEVYNSCDECYDSFPCLCSIAWPDVNGTLSYIDCNNDVQVITGLDPNEQYGKVCVKKWITARSPLYYGDCTLEIVDQQNVYTCPVVPYPKRPVIPGYTTPTCSTEKYEKITCKSSEILYKTVLEKRYGISNCCPDEDNKWLIKKELIDLQAAVDPDYTCSPVQTCCTATPSCKCGCNN